MILRMSSSDSDGKLYASSVEEVEVSSREEASAYLSEDLARTASDDFLHKALTAWFTSGKIESLDEGNGTFWSVELDTTPDSQ